MFIQDFMFSFNFIKFYNFNIKQFLYIDLSYYSFLKM